MTPAGSRGPLGSQAFRNWSVASDVVATGHPALDGRRIDPPELAFEARALGPGRLGELAARLAGPFAIAVRSRKEIAVACDSVGSIPVYVNRDASVVSDDPRGVAEPPEALDPVKAAELMMAPFVTGTDTLWPDVLRSRAGAVTTVRPGSVSVAQWFEFRPGQAEGPSSDELLDELHAAFEQAMRRTLTIVGDRQLVLPLSGGNDSRIIAAHLARLGRPPDLAFTLGRRDSTEVASGRAIAREFDFRWEPIEHTTADWAARRVDIWTPETAFHLGGISGAPNPYDLLALHRLHDAGLVEAHAVFMPGHTGDVIFGSQIPAQLRRRGACTQSDLVRAVRREHYRRRSVRTLSHLVQAEARMIDDCFDARVHRALGELPERMTSAEAIGYADRFNWLERQSKHIVNSVRAYEAMGHDFVLPWWDPEVLDVANRIPLDLRVGIRLRNLYAARLIPRVDAEPRAARAERLAMELVRRSALDDRVKMLKRRARRLRPGRTYDKDAVGWMGLLDREHFMRSFTGLEDVPTLLVEASLPTLRTGGTADPA